MFTFYSFTREVYNSARGHRRRYRRLSRRLSHEYFTIIQINNAISSNNKQRYNRNTMCLTYHYEDLIQSHELGQQEAQAAEEKFKHHEGVNCDNFQATYVFHVDASVSCFFYAPVISKRAFFAAFPVQRKFIGEDGSGMIPTAGIPCNAKSIDALQHPRHHVEKPRRILTVYRSLGGLGDDEGKQNNNKPAVAPILELKKGACVQNLNGSFSIQLCLSEHIYSENEKHKNIKTFEEAVAYKTAIIKASVLQLVRQLEENRAGASTLVFPRNEDVNEKGLTDDQLFNNLEGESVASFADFLLPSLRAGHDVLVLIPPFKNGYPNMNGAFSVCLRAFDGPNVLPVLGLAHNVDEGDTNPRSKVADNFYVISNCPMTCTVSDGVSPVEPGKDMFELYEAEAYAPAGSQDNEPNYERDDQPDVNENVNGDQYELDFEAFKEACSEFQKARQKEIFQNIEKLITEINATRDNKLVDFVKKTGVHSFNLKLKEFPSTSSTLTAA